MVSKYSLDMTKGPFLKKILRRDNMERIDKINYYLDIAETVAERGTCLRRNYGAIIVKNDEIISTGYVGAPRGRKNCCDILESRRRFRKRFWI